MCSSQAHGGVSVQRVVQARMVCEKVMGVKSKRERKNEVEQVQEEDVERWR